jgi:glycosyltransferase involved in cell wall biosynthesis
VAAPSCTVVVCTRNRAFELERCLKAASLLDYPQFDVLVVDNAPASHEAKSIAARWGARYILEPSVGLSRARNRGARASTSEIVAFVDDDAIPEPSWLSGLVAEFQDPSVMAVSGRTLPLTVSSIEDQQRAIITGADFGGDERRVVNQNTQDWFQLVNFGGIGNGANIAFRRCVFDFCPGFDERLGKGAKLEGSEEHHAFSTVVGRGYSVAYTPHGVVRHPIPHGDLKEFRRIYLHRLRTTGAYIALLYCEAPNNRRDVMRFVARRLREGTPNWRSQSMQLSSRVIPRWRAAIAFLSGIILYARMRLGSLGSHPSRDDGSHPACS